MRTRVASQPSPLAVHSASVGDIHTVAISHGEGRFVAAARACWTQLIANGQIATQYVDLDGSPVHGHGVSTPTAPCCAIEGITSPDGRVLRQDGPHRAHAASGLYKNVTGDKYQPIFEGGVDYFKI